MAALTDASFRIRPEYQTDDLIAGENIISCRVTLHTEGIYVFQTTQVIASVSQEALDALHQSDEPAEPDAPPEPDQP